MTPRMVSQTDFWSTSSGCFASGSSPRRQMHNNLPERLSPRRAAIWAPPDWCNKLPFGAYFCGLLHLAVARAANCTTASKNAYPPVCCHFGLPPNGVTNCHLEQIFVVLCIWQLPALPTAQQPPRTLILPACCHFGLPPNGATKCRLEQMLWCFASGSCPAGVSSPRRAPGARHYAAPHPSIPPTTAIWWSTLVKPTSQT